jgi:HAD superfamily hydrolase (TIGR01549 family)
VRVTQPDGSRPVSQAPGGANVKYDTLLFDLFGTVVHFATTVPTVAAGGERRRSTLGWLESTVAEELPGIAFPDFLAGVLGVTREIMAGRAPEYLEVSSPERFRRTLVRLGVDATLAAELAPKLSAVHMRHLASQTVLPDGHRELLASLQQRYRMGIVSNFDHGPTALAILRDHGVADAFGTITVSDGFGRRKPHPSIFLHAMESLGAVPERTLFVGDSLEDDVAGARAAGLPVVWIRGEEPGDPDPPVPCPDFVVHRLVDIEALLA